MFPIESEEKGRKCSNWLPSSDRDLMTSGKIRPSQFPWSERVLRQCRQSIRRNDRGVGKSRVTHSCLCAPFDKAASDNMGVIAASRIVSCVR